MRKGYAASNGWHGMLYGFAFFSVWVQLLGNDVSKVTQLDMIFSASHIFNPAF